jgi:hypothetical protein
MNYLQQNFVLWPLLPSYDSYLNVFMISQYFSISNSILQDWHVLTSLYILVFASIG